MSYGHTEEVTVHFDDLDPMGIVHNARYAVLVERALAPYWAERGHSFTDGRPSTPDVVHAVREFAITYRAPIRGTGRVAVHFWLDRLGERSAEYGFRVASLDGATVHAEGRRAIVRLDPGHAAPGTVEPGRPRGRGVAAQAGGARKNRRMSAAHSASSTPL